MVLLRGVHGPVKLFPELLSLVHVDVIEDVLVHHVRLSETDRQRERDEMSTALSLTSFNL